MGKIRKLRNLDITDKIIILPLLILSISLVLYLTTAVLFATLGINLNNKPEGALMFFVLLPVLCGAVLYWKLEL